MVLGWLENLSKDEVPPEYLWEDSEGLDDWWKAVEAKREDGMPTVSGRRDEDDEDGPDDPHVMVQNDYAQYLKEG